MAERSYTLPAKGDRWKIVKWTGLTGGDTGQAYELSKFTNASIHVKGTFNSQTLTIQGENDPDGTATWATLNDAQGNALSFTVEKIERLLENVHKIRPSVSAGTGVSLEVYMKIED